TDSEFEPYVTPSAMFFGSRVLGSYPRLFAAAGSGTSFGRPAQLLSDAFLNPENPVVSLEQLTLYFGASPDPASQRDIWSASRASRDQPFGTPRRLTELNTVGMDYPVWISDDSCRLYILTDRDARGRALWMASRRGD